MANRYASLSASDFDDNGNPLNPLFKHSDIRQHLYETTSKEDKVLSHIPDPPDAITRKSVFKTIVIYTLFTNFFQTTAFYGLSGMKLKFYSSQYNLSMLTSVFLYHS